VHVLKFQSFLDHFGPLTKTKPDIVSRVMDVLSDKSFWGDISNADASSVLAALPAGTYLIRMGHKTPGCFVINYVRSDRAISHAQVDQKNGIFTCSKLKDVQTRTLSEMMKKLKGKYSSALKTPATPKSPFAI